MLTTVLTAPAAEAAPATPQGPMPAGPTRTNTAAGTQVADRAEEEKATPAAADLRRLRARVEERWRVVRTRDGLVLVSRRGGARAAGVELIRDQVLVDGRSVSGAELRQRLGSDAEVILALSYLDSGTREALFDGTRSEAAPAPVPPATTGPTEPVRQRHGARVRLGSDVTVREHESVDDDVVAILGSVTVEGEVRGDVVAVGGGVRLGPRAVVRGEVTAVGGRIHADPQAKMLGGTNEVAVGWPHGWDGVAVSPDVRLGLPDRRWWAGAAFAATSGRLLVVGLLGLIAVLIGGAWYRRAGEQATATPGQAIVVGLGAQIVLLPAIALLCMALLVSIIGIPVLALVPVALLAGAAVWLIGFAAVVERVGRRVLRLVFTEPVSSTAAFVGGFAGITAMLWLTRAAWWADWIGLGTAIVLGLVGTVIEGLAWSAGLGALILAALRGRQSQPALAPRPLEPLPTTSSGL
jgi:hypothetical protein